MLEFTNPLAFMASDTHTPHTFLKRVQIWSLYKSYWGTPISKQQRFMQRFQTEYYRRLKVRSIQSLQRNEQKRIPSAK